MERDMHPILKSALLAAHEEMDDEIAKKRGPIGRALNRLNPNRQKGLMPAGGTTEAQRIMSKKPFDFDTWRYMRDRKDGVLKPSLRDAANESVSRWVLGDALHRAKEANNDPLSDARVISQNKKYLNYLEAAHPRKRTGSYK
jgi:hypothetical protein